MKQFLSRVLWFIIWASGCILLGAMLAYAF